MNKWTKTAGLLFMAAASVYSDRAIAAKPAKPGTTGDKSAATDVKLLDETDPFANAGPATAPSAASNNSSDPKRPIAPLQLNPDGTFSLNITAGADIVEQLRVIGFQAQSSIIPSKEVHGSLPAMDLYNVTVHEALDALLQTNGYKWVEKGKFIYVYSAKEIQEIQKAQQIAHTEVFRLFYTPAANAVTLIKPVLSADGQAAVTTPAKGGLSTGVTDTGGGDHATEDMIVVTDYTENLDRVRQVIKEIDRRPQQILIEATILSAKLSEDNALGVDFNIVGGVDFSTITSSNGQIGTANVGSFGNQNAHSVGTGNAFSKGIADGLKVGVVTNNVSVFVSALEGITDTTVLANPKVLALNKMKGEVIVGTETGYVTTTTTETSSTQTIEFLKTGTRLVFRPTIGDDGYIRMELHPEDSDGGLQTAQNLPYKNTTEVTSNVMVKDGHTIVIGGLFREKSSSTRSQIPGVGNLPLVGPLFRQQKDSTIRDEVIILITPHIVKDDAEYARLSDAELKNVDKLRVGVRKGMMFWGRERLAEMNYEEAVAAMNKGNRSKAMWHLDAATNLNPKYLEAINLKQELTGKVLMSSDNSSIRGFVSRAIISDRAPATQPKVDASNSIAPLADRPATQPVAQGPTSQPSNVAATEWQQNDEFAAGPTTGPASQPSVVDASEEEFWEEDADDQIDASELVSNPTTLPSAVTELPIEELPSANSSSDLNK